MNKIILAAVELSGTYGKARIVQTDKGIFLYSYNTPVLRWDGEKLHRLWGGWSSTTQRHINTLLWQVWRKDKPFITITKKVWESMPVEEM